MPKKKTVVKNVKLTPHITSLFATHDGTIYAHGMQGELFLVQGTKLKQVTK